MPYSSGSYLRGARARGSRNRRCTTTSDLFRLVVPHYKRAEDEGRTLIQSALNGPATIEVNDKELHLTMAPLSSAHRTRAIAALYAEMDRRAAMFPGTRLRLRYAVEGAR
jgi:hypothetical protein